MDKRYAIAAVAAVLLVLAGLIFIYQPSNKFGANPPAPMPAASATPTPTPIPQHEVYVANMGDHSILGFAIDSNGTVSATPTRVIQGPGTGLHNPFDVVTDSAERIYVANLGDPPGNVSTVTVYSATASGNASPVRTLGLFQAAGSDLTKAVSVAIRRRPEGVLVVDQISNLRFGGAQIVEFSATVGQDGSIRRIRGGATQLQTPAGIVLDQLQRIYVAETVQPRILIYPAMQPLSTVDLPPEAVIEGPGTGLNNPCDVALDATGNIFVVNRGSLNPNLADASIMVYAAAATGDAAPIRVIGLGGPNANLVDPIGIAVDARDRIFLLQGGSLKIFAAGANGDPGPSQTISGGINNPGGLWVR